MGDAREKINVSPTGNLNLRDQSALLIDHSMSLKKDLMVAASQPMKWMMNDRSCVELLRQLVTADFE